LMFGIVKSDDEPVIASIMFGGTKNLQRTFKREVGVHVSDLYKLVREGVISRYTAKRSENTPYTLFAMETLNARSVENKIKKVIIRLGFEINHGKRINLQSKDRKITPKELLKRLKDLIQCESIEKYLIHKNVEYETLNSLPTNVN